jgi:hypothetical protein
LLSSIVSIETSKRSSRVKGDDEGVEEAEDDEEDDEDDEEEDDEELETTATAGADEVAGVMCSSATLSLRAREAASAAFAAVIRPSEEPAERRRKHKNISEISNSDEQHNQPLKRFLTLCLHAFVRRWLATFLGRLFRLLSSATHRS